MKWIISSVYIVGVVISYMVSMLITKRKPSEWGSHGILDEDFVYHIFSFFWPIVLPFVLIGLVAAGFIRLMDKFYEYVKGEE
jgi:hypothetical protein